MLLPVHISMPMYTSAVSRIWIVTLLITGSFFSGLDKVYGQPVNVTSSKILLDLQKLNVLGNVLYFGAHPDDENPTVIAFLANEKHYNTAYFSLTRGDGGQNAIGTEVRENLGIIRTQELLKARQIDGGLQFFSSAIDFGFSKSAEEAFTVWDKEKLLSEAVWVIRKFRPDVIIARFPPDERAGHGQHIASAILAEEAFDAAADPNRFPEQLQYVQPWKTKRLVWNAGMWWNQKRDDVDKTDAQESIRLDVGKYNCLLGKSYGEMAAESRSQHRSQAFGTTSFRGTLIEYFKHVKGEKTTADLFDGVNTTWGRVKTSGKIQELVSAAIKDYSPANPSGSLRSLLAIRSEIGKLPAGYWKTTKLNETDQLIKASLGLFVSATSTKNTYIPGRKLDFQVEIINRSPNGVILKTIRLPYHSTDSLANETLTENEKIEFSSTVNIPAEAEYSQPYWLKEEGTQGHFRISNIQDIGKPETGVAPKVTLTFEIDHQNLTYDIPVIYHKTDPILGERWQPVSITPPVFVSLDQNVYLFDGAASKKVTVKVRSGQEYTSGKVNLRIPDGWRAEPAEITFELRGEETEQDFSFDLFPPDRDQQADIVAQVVHQDQVYDRSQQIISYDHIPIQRYSLKARARVVRTDIVHKGNTIGYLKGAGDLVPASLQQIGFDVTELHENDITPENLQKFDAVIIGVRAYNIVSKIKAFNPVLLKYVEEGGNLIVQYNSDQGLLMDNFGPYPFKLSSKRVTVENAAVRFLDPQCQALCAPNKITDRDFEGWVQERSLYQPEDWSDRYEAVIGCGDPGSEELTGGILIARHGKGYYVYTTMSWFRQLPAGVPGAYRIFTNLISLGK